MSDRTSNHCQTISDPVSRIDHSSPGPSSKTKLRKGSVATLRRNPSIRDLGVLIFQKIPDRIFKRSNQSEVCLPSQTTSLFNTVTPHPEPKVSLDTGMNRSKPVEVETTLSLNKTDSNNPPVPSKDRSRMDWAPEFTPVSFTPTLSVDITPLSPPTSPPPSRSQTLSSFRRKLSLRSLASSPQKINTQRPATSSHCSTSTHSLASPRTHERRRSKYLNDPIVLSMLDRKFEDALEKGFASPPPTPHNRSPSPNTDVRQRSPVTPSVDGTTIVDTIEEGDEEDEDVFTRPTPDLGLPTLKELDDGEWKDGQGNMMTLHLTLTPAACLTEADEELPLDSSPGRFGRRMSGLGRILSRTRSRKVKI